MGDTVISQAIEDDFLVGTIVYLGMDRARVMWPDGTNSTERYQDLVLVQEAGSDHPKFLGIMEGPLIHDEDIPTEYRQIIVDQGLPGHSKHGAEGSLNPSGIGGPSIEVPGRNLAIHDNITLRAFWDAKAKFEEQQIAKSLLTGTTKTLISPIDSSVAHRNIATPHSDWEPGDIVSVSRPGKNAGHLATAHIYRVTPYEADLVWVDPVSGQEIITRESIANLLFVRHDRAWRTEREKYERLEAEAIGIDNTDFYGFKDVGYPVQLIPDPMMYELHYIKTKTRDYLGNQTKKHPVGDNELSEYNLRELQYGGVQQGYQPFVGFERFADYLWR
jgi:hypothetical protein